MKDSVSLSWPLDGSTRILKDQRVHHNVGTAGWMECRGIQTIVYQHSTTSELQKV